MGGGFGSFSDPLIGGTGALIRAVIKSVNFVAGLSGWAIFKDGSYEFGEGGTFRGDLSVVSPSGSEVQVFADAVSARITLLPPDSVTPGVTFQPGQLFTTSASDEPELVLAGPLVNPGGPFAEIDIGASFSQSTMSILADLIVMGDSGVGSSVTIQSLALRVGPDQSDIGRGRAAYAGDTSDSGTVGNADTTVLTAGPTTFRAGRAYEVRLAGRIANNQAVALSPAMRLISSAGTTLHTYGRLSTPLNAEYAIPNPNCIFTVGASDISRSIILQMNSNSAGNTITHKARRWMNIVDIGQAVDFPDAAVLV